MRGRVLWLVLPVALALGIPASADPDVRAETHYKQGKAFLDAKQYDQAIVEFEAAYAIDKLASHLFNIGRAYDAKADYGKAIEYYNRYLEAEPKSPRAAEVRAFIIAATKARADQVAKQTTERLRLEQEAAKVQVGGHVKQAEAYAREGAWVDSGNEHRAAFAIDGDPAHLLAAADAFRKAPDLAKTREAYVAYLDKVPQGGDSDAVRAKVAEITKAIEAAEQARLKDLPKPTPKPIDAAVATMASTAKAAADRGDCSVALTLAGRVKDRDPAYYDGVVVPSLAACVVKPSPDKPRRIGGGAAVHLGLFAPGSIDTSNQDSTRAIRTAGFLHLAPIRQVRLKLGVTTVWVGADYGNRPCADSCPASIKAFLLGPAAALEPVVFHDNSHDVHFILGAVYLAAIAGSYDRQTPTGVMEGTDTIKSQLATDLGIGVRFGRLSLDVVVMQMIGPFSDAAPQIGRSKTISLAFGFSSLR